MLEISFINDTTVIMNQFERLADKLIEQALLILELQEIHLGLAIHWVDGKRAVELNQNYRKKDYIPDVLSFPAEMSSEEIQATGFWEIGDIFICLEEAQRKSEKYNHTVKEEMAFLIVHGFLHLLGYDHEDNEAQQRVMFDFQDRILGACGITYEIRFTADDYE